MKDIDEFDETQDSETLDYRVLEDKNHILNEEMLEDIAVHRSLGAAAKRIYVDDSSKYPLKGINLYLKEGSYVTGVKIIARGKDIREVNRLIEEHKSIYNTRIDDWCKMRGSAELTDGTVEHRAEVHWYQAQTVGKVKWKVKKFLND